MSVDLTSNVDNTVRQSQVFSLSLSINPDNTIISVNNVDNALVVVTRQNYYSSPILLYL